MEAPRITPAPSSGGVLVFGFGTTVAMWSLGYVGRLPVLLLPSPLLLALMLLSLFAGGMILSRYVPGGWKSGAAAGLISGLLNLLVLGSFVSGDRPDVIVPSALWWIPGSILFSALCAAGGAALGARFLRRVAFRNWPAALVKVAIAATLLLLGVGGLVTSARAGLAVTDWPRSFGYNMFLYPFSRMTGDIYYEHAHRLFGALVGLTTLVTAVVLERSDHGRRVKNLGWAALAMVIVQGLLGGLRVTGTLTLSTSPEAMSPNLVLAVVHGVLAQLFLSTLVALGVFTSAGWRGPVEPLRRHSVRMDRFLIVLLLVAMIGQLVLGAVQRHYRELLVFHVILGVAVVAPLAINVGIRAWALNRGRRLLQRLGLGLIAAICLQLALGFGAFAALESTGSLTVRTAHQWFGAVVLATGVCLLCWELRLLAPAETAREWPRHS